ncbi:uncharacterized protein LOC132751888 [Ruditapes philippinarum]|uniref:uncharacterized protein LOC132751888 n=1 Tax=Ruditapes philippinarum TaxID=129788 RepID=UPI00295B1337|nr:uncharacterized protein LOC132751888 [Ruditapes philippinarum]
MLVLKNAARVTLLALVITTEVMTAPSTNETLPGKPLTDVGAFLNKPYLVLAGEVINNLARKFSDDIGNVDKGMESQIGNVTSQMGNVKKDLESQIGNVAKDLRSEMADVAKEICRLHPCTEWSKWNHCGFTYVKGYGNFGRQNRTRNCGFNTTLCKRFSAYQNIEVEFRTCNTCKEDYTVTEHGHCIKFVSTKTTQSTAAKSCQAYGGNLVNINSEMKFKDVTNFVTERSIYPIFWIDGRRASSHSKWEFTTQPKHHSFNHWYPGRPQNDLCLLLIHSGSGSSRKYYIQDYGCSNKQSFMCEVIL